MKKVAIVTDTSGISVEQGKKIGAYVVSMPFNIDGTDYLEGVNLDAETFNAKMKSGADISTSQPAPGSVMDMWDKVLEEYESLVYIPLSSGLSGSYQTANMLADDYDGKVYVVDAKRVSVPMRATIDDAICLAEKGYSAKEIKERLEEEIDNCSIYIMIDDLKYLKKGGRITPAAAAFGQLLRIRPVLQIHGEKLDAYAKARSMDRVKEIIYHALESEMDRMNVHTPDTVRIQAACSYGCELMDEWVNDLKEHFKGFVIEKGYLPLNITCHTGPGCIGAAIVKRLPELSDVYEERVFRRKLALREKRLAYKHEKKKEKILLRSERAIEKLRIKNEKAVKKMHEKHIKIIKKKMDVE